LGGAVERESTFFKEKQSLRGEKGGKEREDKPVPCEKSSWGASCGGEEELQKIRGPLFIRKKE